jgi:hypothetical protein
LIQKLTNAAWLYYVTLNKSRINNSFEVYSVPEALTRTLKTGTGFLTIIFNTLGSSKKFNCIIGNSSVLSDRYGESFLQFALAKFLEVILFSELTGNLKINRSPAFQYLLR